MARFGRVEGRGRWVGAVAAVGWMALAISPAVATVKYGAVQLSGSVDSQNLVRHHNVNEWGFVQNRNTAQLRFEWDWVQNGKLMDRIAVPFIKRSNVFLLYRGVYDGFYDIAPGGNQRGLTRFDDIIGGPIEGNDAGEVDASGNLLPGPYSRFNEHARNARKLENTLREAYIDFKLADMPLSFRFGRQQVIWGESDQFRLMDIWNPLDLTWHVQQEEWDKIRVPLWLLKGIWDIGQFGPISNTFVEMVYNPGDFQPGVKLEFQPNPWSIPVLNPVREGQIQLASPDQPILLAPIFDLQGTSFRKGDFKRNPEEASDVGVRFHGVTPQGFEFTTNYLYIRGRGIGATAGAPFGLKIEEIVVPDALGVPSNAIPGAKFEGLDVYPANVKAKFVHPYVHVFGATGNYFEGDYTNTVFRLETAYALDEPYQTRDNRVVPITDKGAVKDGLSAPIAFTKRDVWAGMVGFDRPTWIKWLNKKTTWFLTGQFFWSYVNGKVAGLRGAIITAGADPYFTPSENRRLPKTLREDGVGQWTSGPYAGLLERTQNASPLGDLADNVRRWETLVTFAGTSFYWGGTLVPFFAVAVDPTNRNLLTQFKIDYFITNNLIFQFQQKFYSALGGDLSIDPWGAGGLLRRRDESGVKLTYQF